MADQFRDVEEAFARLRQRFHDGTISQREFVDTLKQLRIKDDEGRFWMIGARSGKWYRFEGGSWVEAKPPSQRERKAICIACGFENDLEAEFCARCGRRGEAEEAARTCPECGTGLDAGAVACPGCGARLGPAAPAEGGAAAAAVAAAPASESGETVVRALHPMSFFWFFGVLGIFTGIVAGLLAGVTRLFPGFTAGLPAFLADIQGQLLGGLVFSVLGGTAGFVAGGVGGILLAAVSNWVLSLVGGLKVRIGRGSP